MLVIEPHGIFSWDFTVLNGSTPVADIDVSWWREKGELEVSGKRYPVYREGIMSGAFILEDAGEVLARAEKPSALFRRFEVQYRDRMFTLQASSVMTRRFALIENSVEIGSMEPTGLFTRRAAVNFPEDLPLAVRVFMIWLVVILWKRAAQSD